jgi:hypothetical protein
MWSRDFAPIHELFKLPKYKFEWIEIALSENSIHLIHDLFKKFWLSVPECMRARNPLKVSHRTLFAAGILNSHLPKTVR